jgi:predicted metalloendopeptidase
LHLQRFERRFYLITTFGFLGLVVWTFARTYLSHGFDDHERRFDAKGNLRDGSTKEDADKYNVRAIEGFRLEQRFFLAYARIQRGLARDDATKAQVDTDPHAPSKWRLNGPLSNMPEFGKAWGCKDGDAMVRPDSQRARIW